METENGIAENTYSDANYHGGIWRVSEEFFNGIAADSRIRDYTCSYYGSASVPN